MLTARQTAKLLTETDITPDLQLVLRRCREGTSASLGMDVDDVRQGIRRLRAAIRMAEDLLAEYDLSQGKPSNRGTAYRQLAESESSCPRPRQPSHGEAVQPSLRGT